MGRIETPYRSDAKDAERDQDITHLQVTLTLPSCNAYKKLFGRFIAE